jgi:oligopeptidase B
MKLNSKIYQSTLKTGLILAFLLFSGACQKSTDVKPPIAKKIPKDLTIHGDTRIDNYYWMNQRDNPDVINYLKAENAYTEAKLKHTEPLQEKLFNEITGRIKQNDETVPYYKNGYYYYTRYEEGKEYPVYCRKKGGLDADEEIMLNVNEMAVGFNYFQVAGVEVSPDNQMVSFGIDTVGRRKYSIQFKNLVQGNIIDDGIENTTGSAAWANDNRTVFYTTKDSTLRPYKVMKHVLSKPASEDKEIYHESDNTFDTFIYRTKSDKYLMIASFQTLSTEYRFLDANNPDGKFKIIQPRERDLEYYVDHYKNDFYIRTNYHAKNFKLVKTPVNKTDKKYWKDVIAHRDSVLLEEIELFKNFLVVRERIKGLTELRVFKWSDMSDYYLEFQDPTYVANISTNPEFDTDVLRYSYSSLTTPTSIYDLNMVTKEKTLMKQDEVVGDFNPANYKSERLWATAEDGTKVPISLVYRRDMKTDNMPCLLYGYGSYGYSMNPYFSSTRLSLLDRGFIYAIAHIRGGEEMGRDWYENGKLFYKKNTFTDFIDCADYLIAEKYTSPQKLFAMGGSAGGLLIGAVVNMKPQIFKGVIAAVPFVDVVTTMLDESIPLTTGEYDEWGNPNEQKYYEYMKSYSPYDQVKAQEYPAMLVTTGLHDSQVQYWEPAKWVAKLRAMKTDNHLLLLKTDMESGHSGTTGRFKRYRVTALEYAFILDQLGIEN